jgi:hypothetical protein
MRPTKMTKFTLAVLSLALLTFAPPAQADFGLNGFKVTFTNEDGSEASQAGSHPFAMTTGFRVNLDAEGFLTDGRVKDAFLRQIAGFSGDTTAYPRCSSLQFLTIDPASNTNSCPANSAVGVTANGALNPEAWYQSAVYHLVPPPGVADRLGFRVINIDIIVDIVLDPESHEIVATARNIPETEYVYGNKTQLWGNPSDPRHDTLRGRCAGPSAFTVPLSEEFEFVPSASCSLSTSPAGAFITLPTRCDGANVTGYAADRWEEPGALLSSGLPELSDPDWVTGGFETPPFTGCGSLPNFSASISAVPTSRAAQSPTGLDFSLDVRDEGLQNPDGVSKSQIKKAVVTLPEGMTANPAVAEGLEVCSEGQLARETAGSAPGAGCPEASKIGTIEVQSPLIDEPLNGALYQATPYANLTDDSLLGFYMVIKNARYGIIVKQPTKVEPDPETGRLIATADQIPQLPFSHFRLHFREGARSPLVTPPSCGEHKATAVLTPWSGQAPFTASSTFSIVSGPESGPCPSGGLPPFQPSLIAGTRSNAAGEFSSFDLSLTRRDSEQEITNLSIKLPPGVLAKLAGVDICSDAAIAAARSRTGPHGGAEELAAPSCPAGSAVGNTLAGAGVGPNPAYAPGKVYLAGPFNGRPLSLVAITAGVVGPFDIGTVVVRFAIDVNPETGEVFLDSTGSDPIPHIIKGVQLHVREIRALTDRPDFTLNPTSCEVTSTSATVLGSGLDFVSAADDNPFVSTSRFQAADCAALEFKPKLRFELKGGTRRGANPSLRAHVAMTGFGEAAIRYAQVTLPKSEFLEQGHIGTVCTRVQFNAGTVPGAQCPAASVYGKVQARTPILSEPLSGPVFLRSSEHKLPDLVAALHGSLIDVNLVGRIDSGKNGGIRNTFEFVPDAPVTSADFTFFGGKKSLLANSRNLCKSTNKVKVFLKAHSGKQVTYKTPLKPLGCKKHKKKRRHSRPARRR